MSDAAQVDDDHRAQSPRGDEFRRYENLQIWSRLWIRCRWCMLSSACYMLLLGTLPQLHMIGHAICSVTSLHSIPYDHRLTEEAGALRLGITRSLRHCSLIFSRLIVQSSFCHACNLQAEISDRYIKAQYLQSNNSASGLFHVLYLAFQPLFSARPPCQCVQIKALFVVPLCCIISA